MCEVVERHRRALRFETLDEVMHEVHRLQCGWRARGNWSLGQVCHHLAASFHGSMHGFGVDRHRIMRTLFGRRALREVFKTNTIAPWFTVTERLNPPQDVDVATTTGALEIAIREFQQHDGPMHLHPFFGRLTYHEWERLHRIHSAHHLSLIDSTNA